jgi:glycerate 2-kinase
MFLIPLDGRPINAVYGAIPEQKKAIIEFASATGLHLLNEEELNPNIASSFGTGKIIRQAMDAGYTSFIICLGGSATNDGGSGLLKALGFRFLDDQGQELAEGGLALQKLAKIDLANADPRLKRCNFRVASDVKNPLVGPNGASAVFGPQKGATEADVKELDKSLTRFADVIESDLCVRVHDMPGAGAAGGTAAGLVALLDAEILSGVELVKETVGFDEMLIQEKPGLILTGEGKMDAQTDFGKVIAGICSSGKKKGIPVVALAGSISGEFQQLFEWGLTAAFSIANGPMTLQESIREASKLVELQVEQLLRVLTIERRK